VSLGEKFKAPQR